MAYNYIDSTGVIVPDTATLQTDIENEYKTAFNNADLVVTPDTPQGALITAETLARDSVVRNNAAIANQINPNIAGGVFLDAIWALTGGQRVQATKSTITGVVVTGVSGTLIPSGSRAKTVNGDVFETTSAVTIPISNSITVNMQSVEFGAIPAAANTLNSIVDGVLGWETVNNPNAATLGTAQESDEASRRRRRQTLALMGKSLAAAVLSAVYNVDGVKSAVFRENIESTSQTIDGVLLVANSIYVCVDGGLDADIGQALLESKSAGCNYTGNTVLASVIDPISGQDYINKIKFQRPDEIQILCKVTIKAPASISDPTTITVNSIVAWANGELADEDGLIVGADVSPFEIAGAVNRANPTIYVQKVEIAVSAGSPIYQTTTIVIGIDQVARLQASAIQVIIV